MIAITACSNDAETARTLPAITGTAAIIETSTPTASTLADSVVPDGKIAQSNTRTETIKIEGTEEEIITQLYVSTERYSFYYDASRFSVSEKDGIVELHDISGDASLGVLSIEHKNDQSIDIVSQQVYSLMNDKYNSVEWLKDSFALEDGTLIQTRFRACDEQDSLGASFYFVDDRKGGTYILTLSDGSNYEAIEGTGVRLIITMKSFSSLY